LSGLRHWFSRGPATDRARPVGQGRWVVVDVESSGLDASRDRLIAVGALAVTDGSVDLGDAFEAVLRQDTPSGQANIEVHGIGAVEQSRGEDPREALDAFLAFAGTDPLLAWHAPFDARMLQRGAREHLGRRYTPEWIDLAQLAPLAWPERVAHGTSLDGWLAALDIPVRQRHRAIADCLATAQLFAALLPRMSRLGAPDAGALASLSSGARWLRGPGSS